MAVKVLALASGVTGLADHRMLNGALLAQSGAQAARGGVIVTPGGGDLSTVSAMVARVAGLRAVVPNSIASNLGPYLVVSDANTDITFDAGEASVPRVDRIIIRVRDNANDGSGSTAGSVEYLKGQASGSATAMPNNSILLYEMTVPAGASVGGGGVNFANAVDKRSFISIHGSISPSANNTAMTAIAGPYHGETTYRQDLSTFFTWDGTAWRAKGQISVASASNLSDINNPWNGLVAIARDTMRPWIYNGSAWGQPGSLFVPVGHLIQQSGQSITNGGAAALTFGTGSEVFDTHNFHDTSTNNTRVTPNVPGYYRFTASVNFPAATYTQMGIAVSKNGTRLSPQTISRPDPASGSQQIQTTVTAVANGTTDYFEAVASQSSGSSQTTGVSSTFETSFDWAYIGPTIY